MDFEQGTLRVLLVLLHDFPEFLCEYHFELCNVVPPSCIQMRNLILSAFPRNMRLPDPFTPNLKVCACPCLLPAAGNLYSLLPAYRRTRSRQHGKLDIFLCYHMHHCCLYGSSSTCTNLFCSQFLPRLKPLELWKGSLHRFPASSCASNWASAACLLQRAE